MGLALLSLSLAARASDVEPSGVVNLSASAAIEVPKDLLTVVLMTTREGADAGTVQAQLTRALEAALAEAERSATPGQLEMRVGDFSLVPRVTSRGVITGWQGTAELVLEGRDMPAIGQLVGRIQSLAVSRVTYGLSREAREKYEGDVATQAIARYRARAADYAKQFGYSGYTVREINVVANSEPLPAGIVATLRAQASTAASSEVSLATEAGKAQVSVTVNGSVQMH
jgi:predicted secreted protein